MGAFNTPLPSSLRDESKKAANIVRAFVDSRNNGLDKVIPRSVLERAQGFAIFTVAKAGFLFSARAGSGIVIARLDDGSWSPPSAIGVGGLGFGGQAGAEVTDFLITLNSKQAVASFMSSGSFTLGGNLSVAVGPLGRNAEGSGSVNTKGNLAAMYSYSKTKGLFGGVSVEGSVIMERQDANRLAYGGNPTAKQILCGTFDPPGWAYGLIDVLTSATGLPWGQRWVQDDPLEDSTIGTSSRTSRPDGGYAFGEGVGAGGNQASRKRASSLFSLGSDKDTHRQTALFNDSNGAYTKGKGGSGTVSGRASGTATPERTAPTRPWEAKRASSYLTNLPFSNSPKKNDRRMTGPSSETYNDTADEFVGRERANSIAKRPYAAKPTPSPFADPPSALNSRGGTPTRGTTPDLIQDWDSVKSRETAATRGSPPRSEAELLGHWDTNGNGLSATFARLTASERTPNRSRSSSLVNPLDEIVEDPSMPRKDSRSRERSGSLMRDRGSESNPMRSRSNSAVRHDSVALPHSVRTAVAESEKTSWVQRFHDRKDSYHPPATGRGTWDDPIDEVFGRESGTLHPGGDNTHATRQRAASQPWSSVREVGYAGAYDLNANGTRRRAATLRDDEAGLQPGFSRIPRAAVWDDGVGPKEYPSERSVKSRHSPPSRPSPLASSSVLANSSTRGSSWRGGNDDPGNDGYARALALFDFRGTEAGDLPMRKGDVLIVLASEGDGGEWWKGRLATDGANGQHGIFPANYVEVLDIPPGHKGDIPLSTLKRRVLTFEP